LPGNDSWQARLVKHLLGDAAPFIAAEGAPWVFRLAHADADHYFMINEGPEAPLTFTRLPFAYRTAADVLTGDPINLNAPITVERDGARWIRCEK
jgi:beta-galactosidase